MQLYRPIEYSLTIYGNSVTQSVKVSKLSIVYYRGRSQNFDRDGAKRGQ